MTVERLLSTSEQCMPASCSMQQQQSGTSQLCSYLVAGHLLYVAPGRPLDQGVTGFENRRGRPGSTGPGPTCHSDRLALAKMCKVLLGPKICRGRPGKPSPNGGGFKQPRGVFSELSYPALDRSSVRMRRLLVLQILCSSLLGGLGIAKHKRETRQETFTPGIAAVMYERPAWGCTLSCADLCSTPQRADSRLWPAQCTMVGTSPAGQKSLNI